MTRDFILTWAPKFEELVVRVDPVGLKDWCSPLGMVQWVVGHAVCGAPQRWGETRRDDCVTVMGVAGRWEGLLYHQPFVILDTLFAARPETKSKKKKAIDNIFAQPAAAQVGGVYYAQANIPAWAQLPAPVWVGYNPDPVFLEEPRQLEIVQRRLVDE